MELISEEVAEILAARLPREIGAIVLEFLRAEVDRVAAAFREVVKGVEWMNEYKIGDIVMNLRIEAYASG